jgi:hypothetical protein
LKNFKNNIKIHYHRLSYFENILNFFSLIKEKEETQDINSFGFNQISEKSAFFDNWNVSYVRLGIILW